MLTSGSNTDTTPSVEQVHSPGKKLMYAYQWQQDSDATQAVQKVSQVTGAA